jgi:cell division protein FtsW
MLIKGIIAGLMPGGQVLLLVYRSQTSTLASVVLFTFVARYLSKSRETPITLKLHYGSFWFGILYVNSHFAG